MTENNIKINPWLAPFSWIYGLGVGIRNQLFEMNVLKSRSFDIPVISVGNITVGGSGKTPHTEYLIRLLQDKMKVAVLSRGYKRKSKGYQLAGKDTEVHDIGDEPFQMFKKFPNIHVAVDKKRCEGIERIVGDAATSDTDVILLDDAYQHRYVTPGVNILLVDFNRLIIYDKLLPMGRLREPQSGKSRADVVIITKCPADLKPVEYRVLTKALDLYSYQKLFFTTFEYEALSPLYCGEKLTLQQIPANTNVLLLTGIASPQQMMNDLKPYAASIEPLAFPDHHRFSKKDIRKINEAFAELPEPRMLITTEKDNARLFGMEGLSDDVRHNSYKLPVRVKFMLEQGDAFDKYIIEYVRKNSKDSILTRKKNERETIRTSDKASSGNTISFK